MWKLSGTLAVSVLLLGCAGSPAKISTQTYQEVADENFRGESKEYLCEEWDKYGSIQRCSSRLGSNSYICGKVVKALKYEVSRRGLPEGYCDNPVKAERELAEAARQRAFDAQWETETYNIDLLKVTTQSRRNTDVCASGTMHKITIEGQISPDSSFAMDRLLDRLEPCKNSSGRITDPVYVSLKSGGGFLKDGFALGQTFRENQVHAAIEKSSICASSCAVAFLGASTREVEDKGQIMFHAPYFSGKNEYGRRDIDCDVGEESLSELKDYYISMTDKETGERLFERTMWYCSADDGWVVTGGAAAELFGIATER